MVLILRKARISLRLNLSQVGLILQKRKLFKAQSNNLVLQSMKSLYLTSKQRKISHQ